MKIEERFYHGRILRPRTQHQLGLDGDLVMIVTVWGEPDAATTFFSDVEMYLSAALADHDVTSPFAVLDCIDSLTNRLRIALLMVNDRLNRAFNRSEYRSGVESLVLMKQGGRLSWAQVGGPALLHWSSKSKKLFLVSSGGQSHDEVGEGLPMIPVDCMGLQSSCNIRFGQFQLQCQDEILLLSGQELIVPLFCEMGSRLMDPTKIPLENLSKGLIRANPEAPFWLARVNDDSPA